MFNNSLCVGTVSCVCGYSCMHTCLHQQEKIRSHPLLLFHIPYIFKARVSKYPGIISVHCDDCTESLRNLLVHAFSDLEECHHAQLLLFFVLNVDSIF